jgi:hypothetical protein
MTAKTRAPALLAVESLSTLSNPWRPEDLDVCR